jgi:hypothetical protein
MVVNMDGCEKRHRDVKTKAKRGNSQANCSIARRETGEVLERSPA